MNNNFLSAAIFFFSFVLLLLAGILYFDYVKVSEFVCYYGMNPSSGLTSSIVENMTILLGSKVSNANSNVNCVKKDPSDFVCPSNYYRTQYLGIGHYSLVDVEDRMNVSWSRFQNVT